MKKSELFLNRIKIKVDEMNEMGKNAQIYRKNDDIQESASLFKMVYEKICFVEQLVEIYNELFEPQIAIKCIKDEDDCFKLNFKLEWLIG